MEKKLERMEEFKRENNGHTPETNILWQLKEKINEVIDFINDNKENETKVEEIRGEIMEKQNLVEKGTEFNDGVEAGYRYILNLKSLKTKQ